MGELGLMCGAPGRWAGLRLQGLGLAGLGLCGHEGQQLEQQQGRQGQRVGRQQGQGERQRGQGETRERGRGRRGLVLG